MTNKETPLRVSRQCSPTTCCKKRLSKLVSYIIDQNQYEVDLAIRRVAREKGVRNKAFPPCGDRTKQPETIKFLCRMDYYVAVTNWRGHQGIMEKFSFFLFNSRVR